MKKVVSLLLALVLCVSLFASCGAKTQPETTAAPSTEAETVPAVKADVNIAVLKGPTGMGAAKLMADNDAGTAANNYTFTVAAAPDQITAKLVSGELNIAALPTNAVSALYNKTQGAVKLAAINTLGVLYILAKGDDVNSFADLSGKTILASGQGSTPEYVLNYLLNENGLTVGEDVTVDYADEHAEVVTQAVSGAYDVVLLPEPFVTTLLSKDAGFAVKISLTEAWEQATGKQLAMGAIAVRADFAAEHKDALDAFLAEYARSVEYVNANPEEAGKLIEQYDIAAAAVATKAIPNCAMVCLTGETMKDSASQFLSVLADTDAKAVGGTLPADDFYYGV
ncbi:MAG: ABC transporter substrate-binding protein [Clostridia bacterium]|nr:ABC transporter substrate-binding protein [Clostridia bacterium]